MKLPFLKYGLLSTTEELHTNFLKKMFVSNTTRVCMVSLKSGEFFVLIALINFVTEIWWVVRSRSGFTVQKRKGFNVTNPPCTFDATNNR